MLHRFSTLGLVGAAVCAFGCSGAIGNGGSAPSGSGTSAGVGSGSGTGTGSMAGQGAGQPTGPTIATSALPSDSATVPAVQPLRRLNHSEYVNTIRDLLGVAVPADRLQAFSSDEDPTSSGFVVGGSVDAAPDAQTFMFAAEDVATAALQRMSALLPCNPMPSVQSDQDACAQTFLAGFGRRAYRRPLLPQETADLNALYQAQRAPDIGATFPQAVANVIAAVLQSPYFLYRSELGSTAPVAQNGIIHLNQNEIASQLSYMFWSSMPDDKLFAAADAGQLATPDQIAAQARRMLGDPKALDALTDFSLQWMVVGVLGQLPKDPSFTDYSADVAQSMLNETRAFLGSVFQGPKADGKLSTLLTSNASFADANLGKIYGIDVKGTDMQPVTLDKTQRAGILTQGTFLTAQADSTDSEPIQRGNTVLSRLMCTQLIVPGNLVIPPLAEPQPGQTTRERVATHAMNPCATCHQLIDPIGFAFENYDAVGAYRTMDAGKPVDASGSFPLDKGTATFKSAIDLMPQLAASDNVRDCMATQWWGYALRREEQSGEDPSMNLVRAAFKMSGYDMRELLVALTQTKSFSYRTPAPQEVMP